MSLSSPVRHARIRESIEDRLARYGDALEVAATDCRWEIAAALKRVRGGDPVDWQALRARLGALCDAGMLAQHDAEILREDRMGRDSDE